jgi:hypothetical protein
MCPPQPWVLMLMETVSHSSTDFTSTRGSPDSI